MKILKYLRIIYKITSALVYYGITYLIPKDNRLWVFGAWKGKTYSDNSRAFFEYVSKDHPEIKALWIAKNKKVYKEVKALGLNVLDYSKWKTKWIIARAKVNIQTESNEDTGKYRVGGTKVIQLFHGVGGVKDFRLYAGMGRIKKALVKIYADNHHTSYWMVVSDYYAQRYSIQCETDLNRTFVTGQPRTDVVLKKEKVPFFENFINNHPETKTILYAPTHRNYGIDGKMMFTLEEWDTFNQYLMNNNYVLFFKPHPNELSIYEGKFSSFSNIILVTPEIPLPNDPCIYLHYFNLLITDYSTIAADYMVLERPIIHYMFDYDTFDSEDFKLTEVENFAGGAICKDWEELYKGIDESLNGDKYSEIREKALNRIYKYVDNHNCERVYNTILNIINE